MSVGFRKLGHWPSFNSVRQLDLEIRVNRGTTARLMLLSQFVPKKFLIAETEWIVF